VAQVAWTERARDDLRDIYDYIARDSPRAAQARVDEELDGVLRVLEK
jgi:plasmid stabilization system protein ParE